MHTTRKGLPIASCALYGILALALLLQGCAGQPVLPRPTEPPAVPTMDVVGTVTAQAGPIVGTQTAIAAAATQIAGAQATLTVQAQAAAVSSTGTAIAQTSASQVAMATSLAGTAEAQASTATALTAANATIVAATSPRAPTGVVSARAMSATPVASRKPVPTSALACVQIDPEFSTVAADAAKSGLDPGCAVGPAQANVTGALQEYWANVSLSDPKMHWRSPAIWREDAGEIYIVKGADTRASQGELLVYPDLYVDGQPEVPPACAEMPPPGGSQMPVRGFGKAWCDHGLATVIGWPNQREVAATLRVQPTRNGMLMKVSAPNSQPPVGYLIAMDYQSGRAVTRLTSP